MKSSPIIRDAVHEGIVLSNVTFCYPRVDVLVNVSLEVPSGSTIMITGANGAGKSTLLYLLAGLVPVQAGTLTMAGIRPDPARPHLLVHAGVRSGFVFQESGLLANMNALANVALPLRYHADVLGIDMDQIERRAKQALDRVRVTTEEMYELPAHLSFGVRKRVALARAIAVEPNFFFFDDPDVGLDPRTAALMQEILCAYRDDPKVTMIVASNRDSLVARLGVPAYLLKGGQLTMRPEPSLILSSGPPRSVA